MSIHRRAATGRPNHRHNLGLLFVEGIWRMVLNCTSCYYKQLSGCVTNDNKSPIVALVSLPPHTGNVTILTEANQTALLVLLPFYCTFPYPALSQYQFSLWGCFSGVKSIMHTNIKQSIEKHTAVC
ncbi:hypothetical protein TNCV_1312231 [Trichonephila clavipes]|nr:hypothetical protein TNCV_1312231 [Trichonephila clavipes]